MASAASAGAMPWRTARVAAKLFVKSGEAGSMFQLDWLVAGSNVIASVPGSRG